MLTAETLRQLLDYDPATGVFTWFPREETDRFVKTWNARFAGKTAGRSKPNKNGYLEIAIDGKLYYIQRLAWLYMTGEWPSVNVDHEDRNKSNNRWSNLREATVPQNARNMAAHKDNKSGFKGVSVTSIACAKKFVAFIRVEGKNRNLGYYYTAEEAHEAYKAAAAKHHGEFARAA